MIRHLQTFDYTLNCAWKSAIAKYNVDLNDRQVRSVFNSLDNLIRSRRQALDTLYVRSSYAILYEKPHSRLNELRAGLADDPRRVVLSFHKRIAKNKVDLGDPRALAAFEAASHILDRFLQLEHEYIRAYLVEVQTHLRLRRARRRKQTLELSRSKGERPQEAKNAS
jgi:hypothetical protein